MAIFIIFDLLKERERKKERKKEYINDYVEKKKIY